MSHPIKRIDGNAELAKQILEPGKREWILEKLTEALKGTMRQTNIIVAEMNEVGSSETSADSWRKPLKDMLEGIGEEVAARTKKSFINGEELSTLMDSNNGPKLASETPHVFPDDGFGLLLNVHTTEKALSWPGEGVPPTVVEVVIVSKEDWIFGMQLIAANNKFGKPKV